MGWKSDHRAFGNQDRESGGHCRGSKLILPLPKTPARLDRRFRGNSAEIHSYLFAFWNKMSIRLKGAEQIALFLDFDGTLAELRPRPEQVHLSKAVRQILVRLATHSKITVAVISGRKLSDVRKRVGVRGIAYFGLLGLERNGHKPSKSRRMLAAANQVKAAVSQTVQGLPGIWIEDKTFGFTVHFRDATPEFARKARHRLRTTIRTFSQTFRIVSGKKVWEFLPQTAPRKGQTAKEILARLPKSTVPIYIGDDSIDESAFGALRRGITVHVGHSKRTRARYWLRNPADVYRFLRKLEEELCNGLPTPSVS
jgi:trehalose-phosphatase